MNRIVGLLTISLFCLVSIPVSVSVADEIVKAGEEFQVNTFTISAQVFPEIAVDSQGDFIVVWHSAGQDGNSFGIFGQRIGADGTPLGTEFQINTHTTSIQTWPFVATDGPGNFIVVWQSFGQDGAGYGVFGQRFDSSGGALGEEFQVNTYTTDNQRRATVAADDAGNFLVVWESTTQDESLGGIYGQLYDSSGNAIGGEFQVNTTNSGDQNYPIAFARNGGFAGDDGFGVVWASEFVDDSETAVMMQFLDSIGTPVGGEMQVNTYTLDEQERPAAAVSPDGTIAVVWRSEGQEADRGVFGQVFDSRGAPVGSELHLNIFSFGVQDHPSVAFDGTEGFVVAWHSQGQVDDPDYLDIFARRVDATGALVGGEFLVNQRVFNDQGSPSVGGGVDGRFMVLWNSSGNADGSGPGVFGQRFDTAFFADGFESEDTSAWSVTTP